MLAYYFPPSKAAGTFRTLRFVRDLPDCGWKPIVLTVRAGTYPDGDCDPALLHKVPNTVRVFRTPAPPLHRWFKQAIQAGRAPFGRRPNRAPGAAATRGSAEPMALTRGRPGSVTEWIYTLLRTPDVDAGWRAFAVLRGVWLVWTQRPRVIYATGGPWTTLLAARDISRLTGVPLVLDYRDPWSANPAAHRSGWFETRAKALERGPLRRAAHVVANTDVLRHALVAAYGPDVATRCTIIHNSYDEADYATPAPPRPELPTFSYVGSLYDAHSPEPFLQALQRLLAERPALRGTFRVRLVGSGAARVTQQVLGLGLDDTVEVRAPVPHAEAVALQRSSHALLLFLTVDSDHSTFIPSKLFEYIAARRPIFAVTRGGALQRLLARRDITPWVYSPADADGIVAGLADLVERATRGSLPEFSDDFVRSFSGRAAARSLASVLDRVANTEPPSSSADARPADAELAGTGAR